MGATVEIAEYDPAWPEAYERERAAIAEALGGHLLAIEHVGSTSVPGLGAKPIVDIMAGLRPGHARAWRPGGSATSTGEFGPPDPFRKPVKGRTHQIPWWSRARFLRPYALPRLSARIPTSVGLPAVEAGLAGGSTDVGVCRQGRNSSVGAGEGESGVGQDGRAMTGKR
jgi:hypothetical protein